MTETEQARVWLAAACRGDRLALAKLLALNHPTLAARAAERLEPAVRARVSPEDVLQDTYVQVFREISAFQDRGPDSFLNWVLTILDHRLVDIHRAAHRDRRDVARELAPGAVPTRSYANLLDEVYCDSMTPSRVVRRVEAMEALMTCVATLSADHRRVIELRFLEGLPLSEVARRMQRSEDATVALTQRALRALRAAMDGLGDFTRGG